MNETSRNQSVVLPAPRGEEPRGGSEIIFWEDRRILGTAGAQVDVCECAPVAGAKLQQISVRSQLGAKIRTGGARNR